MHASLCDFLLDIGQNALEAGARRIDIDWIEEGAWLSVRVEDDGRGMTEAALADAMDPFRNDGKKHGGRKLGLGIPFLLQALEMTGGRHLVLTAPGSGTAFSWAFNLGHPDCPPMGDLAGTFRALLSIGGECEMTIRRRRVGRGADPGTEYLLRRSELAAALGSLEEPASLTLLLEYIRSQEASGDEGDAQWLR